VIGVDWRTPLAEAWKRIGHDGRSRATWIRCCSARRARSLLKRAKRVLARRRAPGHIFNLGHGIVPETPVDT
jgi:uroporphyrinogen decarboxylase